ncbi:undecaprenyl/decaprenyl-phosphate alpha-N-acetylglucosaminyl 1-phosphate transferase [bacterium]|nr:undecaprenyl/decaprenyl-phosphate alpha-N-acetylglucosaminyl 1-phosphate transferase [bacterium]
MLRVCRRHGAFDPPDARKIHKRSIPRMGGVALFSAISLGLTAAVIGAMLDWFNLELGQSALVPPIYVGLCGFFFIGFFDDIKSIPAVPRLLAQLAVATLVIVLSGGAVSISAILGNALPAWLGGLCTVLWIVGVVNTFNWIDGLDGLSSGVALIAAAGFLALALLNPTLPNAVLCGTLAAVLIGSVLGFLPHNFFPARIFVGDGGAFSLGYLLAVTSVVGLFKQAALISFLIPLALLALPIFDTAFAILRRLSKGLNPLTPDNRHIHHRLLALMSARYSARIDSEELSQSDLEWVHSKAHPRTVLVLYSITAVGALLAVWLGSR